MDVTVSPDLAGRIGETAGHLASHLTSQAAGRPAGWASASDLPDRPMSIGLRERREQQC
ncbi:MAG TPA: hypothetical protein VGF91_26895 [Solirubrobacteraceae bacterium]|jgi:hypothetical protein